MLNTTFRYTPVLILIFLCECTAYGAANQNELSDTHTNISSAGCGIVQTGTGNFMPMEIRILNQDRKYHLRIPSTYDPSRAYPIIFRWHGYGGNGISGGLGIEFYSGDDAIVIGADGLNNSWDNDSVDLLFFDAMLETIKKQYCIDDNRVFSYGFSAGGFFNNFLACERGDILRASATIAGGAPGGKCKGKVATWFLHDFDDNVVPISEGKAARDQALATNGCSTNTVDEGNGCVRYQGCDATPIVWCESHGIGHNIRGDFAPAQVWKFFSNFR